MSDWTRVAGAQEVEESKIHRIEIQGISILLVRLGENVHAFKDECTHVNAPLCDGLLDGTEIECPWHYARFDVRSGEPTGGPAFDALTIYPVELRDDGVYVSFSDG